MRVSALLTINSARNTGGPQCTRGLATRAQVAAAVSSHQNAFLPQFPNKSCLGRWKNVWETGGLTVLRAGHHHVGAEIKVLVRCRLNQDIFLCNITINKHFKSNEAY